MASDTQSRARRRAISGSVAAVVALAAFAPTVLAGGAAVTRGDVHAFAAGAGQSITGRVQMVRTADGRTLVSLHVEGLLPNTAYGSHVHQAACGTGDADGHFRFDPSGPATPPNEIWLSFTTNAAGIGNSNATAAATAGPNAVSVVVHAPITNAKLACADLG